MENLYLRDEFFSPIINYTLKKSNLIAIPEMKKVIGKNTDTILSYKSLLAIRSGHLSKKTNKNEVWSFVHST